MAVDFIKLSVPRKPHPSSNVLRGSKMTRTLSIFGPLKRWLFPMVVFVVGALVLFVEPVGSHIFPHTPLHVGVRCQNDFQNNWADTIATYGMCTDFIDRIGGGGGGAFFLTFHEHAW